MSRLRGLERVSATELDRFRLERRSIFYPKADIDLPDSAIRAFLTQKDAKALDCQEHVSRACSEFFGEAPASISVLSGKGTFHSIFEVNLSQGKQYFVRLNTTEAAGNGCDFLIDHLLADSLKSSGVPTATLYQVDLSREVCPFDYEIWGRAEGTQLSLFEDRESQEMPSRLLRELGRAAGTIHQIPTVKFGLMDVESVLDPGDSGRSGLHSKWDDYLFLKLEDHLRICRDIKAISLIESVFIERLFENSRPLFADVQPRLLHGDLGNHNVFSDGAVITAIIDWEDCLSGDPVFDIAYWGTFYREHMLAMFLEGYRTVQLIPEDFEARYWLYYLRIALSKTVHRRLFGYSDRPGRPPASSRIQKSLDRLTSLGLN